MPKYFERYCHFIKGQYNGLTFTFFQYRMHNSKFSDEESLIALRLPIRLSTFLIHQKSWWNFFLKEIKLDKPTYLNRSQSVQHLTADLYSKFKDNWSIKLKDEWLVIRIRGVDFWDSKDRIKFIDKCLNVAQTLLINLRCKQ